MPESTAGVDGERVAARPISWAETYDALRVRDPSDMTPREHEQLADAAWWLSKPSESIAARQRAYADLSRPAIPSTRPRWRPG